MPALLVRLDRFPVVNTVLEENGILYINLIAARHKGLAEGCPTHELTIDDRLDDPSPWGSSATGALAHPAEKSKPVFGKEDATRKGANIALRGHPECLGYIDRTFHRLRCLVSEEMANGQG